MFDLTSVKDDNDFSPVPQGFYNVEVEGLEWKMSKAGSEYLNMKLNIFGENYTNRKLFHTFNLFHDKEQVRNIALADIKKIFVASGVDVSKLTSLDKDGLIEILSTCKMQAKVTIKQDMNYGDKNEVKGWKAIEQSMPGQDEPAPF